MQPTSSLSYQDLQPLLSPAALQFFDADQTYPVYRVNAQKLLRSGRFDLGVKANFARSLLQGDDKGYAAALYATHLATWNGFYENTPLKTGIEDFTRSFSELAKTSSQQQVLPVDASFILIDGAHRASLALLDNQEVTVVKSPRSADNYNYEAFASYAKVLQPELAELLLDQMAYCFARFQPDARCICIFPSTEGARASEVEEVISRSCSIFYRKKFVPSAAHFRQLLIHLYYLDDRKWMGGFENDFSGLQEKLSFCFKPECELTLYFVTDLTSDRSIELKEQIRRLFNLQKHACHIGDTHSEVRLLAEMSLHPAAQVYDRVSIPPSFTQFATCFKKLESFVSESGISKEDFCIAGSTLLAMLGVRDCRDIDLLFSSPVQNINLPLGLGNHESERAWYPASFDEITSDPQYYFYFLGFKVARPWVIFKFKKARAENPKDLIDVRSLLGIFPDLDRWVEPHLSIDLTKLVATDSATRILRDKDSLISQYRETISTWYIPESKRAGELQTQLLQKEEEIKELQRRIGLLQEDLASMRNGMLSAQKEKTLMERNAALLKENLRQGQETLDSIRNSTSWKIQNSLRQAISRIRGLFLSRGRT